MKKNIVAIIISGLLIPAISVLVTRATNKLLDKIETKQKEKEENKEIKEA